MEELWICFRTFPPLSNAYLKSEFGLGQHYFLGHRVPGSKLIFLEEKKVKHLLFSLICIYPGLNLMPFLDSPTPKTLEQVFL